ncbi:NAD(P)H-dependent oxidoreductase [Catalinimonas niigatensis]|uniref:NAD(P)H-dependent oxidoreductase n=1 Tax=Catalinimonas niigatensis TaxID=1397264 RepID=UPI002666B07D|nr:NAD(P)-dependent oxidoreductase [Catalinimonas niigatensis]WPP52037.1 NAD(P)-dependent oxidoreductase [Catalinimonas niigatensis]
MIIVDKALQFREDIGNPIRVAIMGAGYMSIGIVNQIIRYTPGMEVSVICNRSIEKAINCYQQAGVNQVVICNNERDLDKHILRREAVVTSDPEIVCKANEVDIIVEATGTIEYAAKVVMSAIEHGKPTVLMNAELDATVGPILKYYADRANVMLSGSDGDQPGVIMNLYRFVKNLGFTPLVCGNIKGFLDIHKNPTDMLSFAENMGQNVNMITNFTDGTKIAFEQATVANATGMVVSQRGMNGFRSNDHIDDLTHLYDVDQLKALGGIVDYAVGAKPGPGVYVYATTEDELSKSYLNYLKLGKGPIYSFYTPYHLCYFEVPNSVARVFHFNDPVLAPIDGPVVEVITTAKTDLKAGQTLDGFGGYTSYGQCENASVCRKENLLPIGLSEGIVLKRDIAKDQAISFDDIVYPENSFMFNLYNEQVKHFFSESIQKEKPLQTI